MHVTELLEYGGNFIYIIGTYIQTCDPLLGIQGAYYDAHHHTRERPTKRIVKTYTWLAGECLSVTWFMQGNTYAQLQRFCEHRSLRFGSGRAGNSLAGMSDIGAKFHSDDLRGKSCLELAQVGTVHRTGWDWTNPGCCGCLATFAFSQETVVFIYQITKIDRHLDTCFGTWYQSFWLAYLNWSRPLVTP